ncbi:hypothetical protein [Paenibacillus terrigena]|uniref:hypothetical protein n=1 Tax=Paenibacillus terrigena TaxID=369333 RepID=UPI00038026F0|nr:hypothetical protein [Paenibacillus terrigena]
MAITENPIPIPVIHAKRQAVSPQWAVMQRRLFDQLNNVHNKWLNVALAGGTTVTLRISMDRYVNAPSYDMPWADPEKQDLLVGRTL